MNLKRTLIALALILVTTQAFAVDRPVWDVPRLDGVTIDGNVADWSGKGFRIGLIENRWGGFPDSSDFGADIRLGWDDRGLLVSFGVRDDAAYEARGDASIGTFDSVALYVSPQRGALERYNVTVTPGVDPDASAARIQVDGYDINGESKDGHAIAWKSAGTPEGYVLEVLFPWADFRKRPQPGSEMGFQFRVMDADSPDDAVIRTWRPLGFPYTDTFAHHRIRLASRKGRDMRAVARGDYERLRETVIRIEAVRELAGKPITIGDDSRTLAQGVLAAAGGHATATVRLPMPARGARYLQLTAEADGRWLADVELPDPDAWRARQLLEEPVLFDSHVFAGESFPACEFRYPYFVEDLIGPYTIETTFYDRDHNVVTKAEQPGRYGAVITVTPRDGGRPFRRFRTLYRWPEDLNSWEDRFDASLGLPEGTGIDQTVADLHEREVKGYVNGRIWSGFHEDIGSGALFAGLHEAQDSDGRPGVSADVWAVDRQWWVGLKRRLYGTGERFPDPVVCPTPVEGPPAPVVREGTLDEAGVSEAGVAAIDSLLTAWAADSDQPFAVCLVRHGVIFLHKAYGQFDGRPMRVTDKTWMASINKSMTGTLAAMLIDRGLLHLDDPVADYLPPFRQEGIDTPITIRHLMTHTNGLWGHWGDRENDFEERIASYYPHLPVGEAYSYNGAGFALAGKVVEAVSGEAIPRFFKRHLLTPLGCDSTDVVGTSGDAMSIPLDMAKLGQLLLNKGSYGRMRFFGEEAFRKMLPRPLTDVVGHQTAHEYGLGLVWCKSDGLGEGTFCHGAASGATYRIDPEHDLVIVMTRNASGKNFSKYYPQLPRAVIAALK